MTNYIAKLLGMALRRMRSNRISSTDVAGILSIHDSKYRSIEAGGQIFDPELIIPLKQIEAFKDLQPDRLALLIAYGYFFQEGIIKGKRALQNTGSETERLKIVEDTIEALSKFDPDISLFLDKGILEESRFDFDTALVNVINFLTKTNTSLDEKAKIAKLKKQLSEIEKDTLCVFYPLVKSYINEIREDLDKLSKYNPINDRINDLEHKIEGIKKLKISFNTINAPEFVNIHKYREVKGTVFKAENLLDLSIIEMYRSYMEQVWEDQLVKIRFLFLDGDEDTLVRIVSKYRSEVMFKSVYCLSHGAVKDENFYPGLGKIEFKFIDKVKQKDALQKLLQGDKEFWFYNSTDNDGEDFKFGFMAFETILNDLIEAAPSKVNKVTQYKILTKQEVQDASDAFDMVWNAALPIF